MAALEDGIRLAKGHLVGRLPDSRWRRSQQEPGEDCRFREWSTQRPRPRIQRRRAAIKEEVGIPRPVTAPFDYLLKTMNLKVILAHGLDAIRHLSGWQGLLVESPTSSMSGAIERWNCWRHSRKLRQGGSAMKLADLEVEDLVAALPCRRLKVGVPSCIGQKRSLRARLRSLLPKSVHDLHRR